MQGMQGVITRSASARDRLVNAVSGKLTAPLTVTRTSTMSDVAYHRTNVIEDRGSIGSLDGY